jgi:protein-L-isoaspartate(D-aspartate) O-methyltransferase
MFFGDGFEGLPQFAPFDRVLVTCGTSIIPHKPFNQLKTGGIMVIPLGEIEDQYTMTKATKSENQSMETAEFGSFRFVPMLQNRSK